MKLKHYLFIFLFIAVALIAINVTANTVSADNHYFTNGGGDGKVSTGTNWNPNNPIRGDTLNFCALSTVAVNFDSVTAFNVNVLANYSGTITVGTNVNWWNYTQLAGTLTGSISYTETIRGNFTFSAGTMTDSLLKPIVVGNNITFTISDTSNAIYQLTVNGKNLLISRTSGTSINVNNLLVNNGGSLNINTGKFVTVKMYSANGAYSNLGEIKGLGTLTLSTYTASYTITYGTINCNVKVDRTSGGSAGAGTIKLASTTIINGTLLVSSSDDADSSILDINGKTLYCKDTTIGVIGILQSSLTNGKIFSNGSTLISGATGKIDNTNINLFYTYNWDSSLGTFIKGSSTVNLTNNAIIKLASLQNFNKLNIIGVYPNDKITVTALTGITLFWNYTSLNKSTSYNYYIDGIYQGVIKSSSSGTIPLSYSSWSTHIFEVRQILGTDTMIDTSSMVFIIIVILMFSLLFISVYAMEWGIIAGLVWIVVSLVTFIPLNSIIGLLILAIGLLLMVFGLNEYLEK